MATQEEIDKIIADAVAESKKQSKWHRPSNKGVSPETIAQARKILNLVFMAMGIAAVIIYFTMPEQRLLFFCIGFGAVILKVVEFILRFMF